MAIYNNGFPASYQPYNPYPQYQQQQPASRLVEVFPVETEADVEKFPVGMGATAVFFARNDSFLAVKSVGVNGQTTCVYYDKRPPEPPAPKFDPADFVRRDEVETLIAAALVAQKKGAAE